MNSFEEGYNYFKDNCAELYNSIQYGNYISTIDNEIKNLENAINSYKGVNSDVNSLKGFIAEEWHANTYNIDLAVNESNNVPKFKAQALNSPSDRNKLGGADIRYGNGKEVSLKYYKTGKDSAKQQAKSFKERFMETKQKNSFESYLEKNGLLDSFENDPLYALQERLIPNDQLEVAKDFLERKIKDESTKRPELVKKYKITLEKITDRLSDEEGNESIPLSERKSREIATKAREGKFEAKDEDIETSKLIETKKIVGDSLKAGISAAGISFIMGYAPIIIGKIKELYNDGFIQEDELIDNTYDVGKESGKAFVKGSITALITYMAESGKFGDKLKDMNPTSTAFIVNLAYDTLIDSIKVAQGKINREQLVNNLIQKTYISLCSKACGEIAQAAFATLKLPTTIGFMLGSFVGTIVGSYTANVGSQIVLSFCITSGCTMFGLVDQDYVLPESVIKEIGLDVFEYEKFELPKTKIEEVEFERFNFDKVELDQFEIIYIRRGVIGINKIGYTY